MLNHTKRETWPHHIEFVLSCIGYAVGYGSIWRFPYLCMRNGGGAFLIPYLFFMITCGVPLFFMELALGQYSSSSPIAVWDICPLLGGLGWTMLYVSGIVALYYNIILTWVMYYLVRSFTATLPWKTCGNWWNTCKCLEDLSFNKTGNVTWDDLQEKFGICSNGTFTSAAEEFWESNTLSISPGIEQLGTIQWHLVVCLAAAWLLIFICLFKGVNSVGKVVYVTATAPYVFLFVLLAVNCTLEGSWNGILFYITPRWETFVERKFTIWAEAASQVFFSLGPAWGGLITLSSFNKFNKNCYRDALLIPAVNCFTSLLGGFVIFSVVGFMAHKSGRPVESVMKAGPGVIFVAYPEAIAQLPLSPVWSILFFTMLITIGVDSQFGMFETVVSSLVDQFPHYLRARKTLFIGVTSLGAFLIALPLTTQGGVYIFTILDWYCGTFTLALVAFLEVVVVCYIYGVRQFRENIKSMIGFMPSSFWTVMWCGVTPFILLAIFCSSFGFYADPTYGEHKFPKWSVILGWIIGMSGLLPIILVALYHLFKPNGGSLRNRWRKSIEPKGKWNFYLTPSSKMSILNEGSFEMNLGQDERIHYLS